MSKDQKQEQIIETAIVRFAHFGVGKTTMNEIAGDLSISKALLYYYFPDKNSLYAAVMEHITQEFATTINEELEKEPDLMKVITIFLEMRTDFIIKYYNIIEYIRKYKPNNMPPALEALFKKIKKGEYERIANILERGRQEKLFKIENATKTAELYHDFLEGFRINFLVQHPTIFPEKKQFQAILKKEKDFSTIFFKGLTLP